MNYTPLLEDAHDCFGCCAVQVARHLFVCRPCWRRLPPERQTAILTTRWAGDLAAHSRAISDAMHWYTVDREDRAAATIREMQ